MLQKIEKIEKHILTSKQRAKHPFADWNIQQLENLSLGPNLNISCNGLFLLLIFEMAAMPFPCNGILVDLGNLPRIFPMCSLIYASFLIPYSNL